MGLDVYINHIMATISSVTIRPESGKPIRISVNGVQQNSGATKKAKLDTPAKKNPAPVKSTSSKLKSTPSRAKPSTKK